MFLTVLILNSALLSLLDYLPVYFQAVQDASPIGSGVDIFPLTLTIPFAAVFAGGTVKSVGRYRPQNYIGWAITVLGFGVMSIVTEKSSRAQYIATQIPAGIGIGMIWVLTQLPILAPLPVSNSAHTLAFHVFVRRMAQVSPAPPSILPLRAAHANALRRALSRRALALRSAVRSSRTSSSGTCPSPTSPRSPKELRLRTRSSRQSPGSRSRSRARCSAHSRTRSGSSGAS